jgi:hypothetical protein
MVCDAPEDCTVSFLSVEEAKQTCAQSAFCNPEDESGTFLSHTSTFLQDYMMTSHHDYCLRTNSLTLSNSFFIHITFFMLMA